jgi:hypothetical protein
VQLKAVVFQGRPGLAALFPGSGSAYREGTLAAAHANIAGQHEARSFRVRGLVPKETAMSITARIAAANLPS